MPTRADFTEKPVVLVVDDNMDDLLIVQMAARRTAPEVDLRAFDNGEEAIAYISGAGKYLDRSAYPMPILLLLDLKMPRVSGFDVLSALSKIQNAERPFICILTTSSLLEDFTKATALGADAFHAKPGNYADLCELLRHLVAGCIPNGKLMSH